jgi:hypothetical protein
VAQNISSNKKNAVGHVPSSRGKKNPVDPIQAPWDVPNISAKPKAQNKMVEIPKSVMFFMATFMLFFDRVRPDSMQVNPACIRNTSPAHIKTQKTSTNDFSIIYSMHFLRRSLMRMSLSIAVARKPFTPNKIMYKKKEPLLILYNMTAALSYLFTLNLYL